MFKQDSVRSSEYMLSVQDKKCLANGMKIYAWYVKEYPLGGWTWNPKDTAQIKELVAHLDLEAFISGEL